jgi:hypothetical protein
MDVYGKIADKLKEIAGGSVQKCSIFTAQVESVNNSTCTVKLDELSISDVRLRAVVNGNNEQVLIKPKKGSYVLVADMLGDFRQLVVVGHSEVEEINVRIDNAELTMNKNGFILNNQGESLNDVLADFITEVTKIIVVQGTSPNVPALEAIKQRLNTILK